MEPLDQGYPDNRFADAVDEDLHCPICLNVLREPLQCQMNEHHFCSPCIRRHLQNFKTCPFCMEDLSSETLRKPARYLTKHLAKLNISCEYLQRGCSQVVKLEDLKRHVSGCGFAPVACTNDGCIEVVNRQDSTRHETELCKSRRVKCHYCADTRREINELKMSFEELKSHVCQMLVEIKEELLNLKPAIQCPHHFDTNENIIVVGGYDGVDRLCSVEMFVWSEKMWLPLKNTHNPRSAASSIVYQNQIIVTGGRIGEQHCLDSMETMHTDKQSAQWCHFPMKLPYQSSGHKCVVYQDQLIVIGGWKANENEISDCIYEVCLVSPHTSKLLSRMELPIHYHGVECFGDKIVIVGGTIGNVYDGGDGVDSVLLFDVQTNICKPVSPLPYALCGMATVTWGENLILIGGKNINNQVLNTVMMYNVKTGHTHKLPPMKYRRFCCSAVVYKNNIVVMGGMNGRRYFDVVEYFSFASYSWNELPPMNEKRSSATAVVTSGNFV